MTQLALLGGTPVLTDEIVNRWPVVDDVDIDRVTDLLRRRELSYNGREGSVKEFEDAFAPISGCEYVLATNSGTSALFSAYYALGLGPGDEVLVPSYTFRSTLTPLLLLGCTPVLVDSNAETGNIDLDDLRSKVTGRTAALVVVHINGFAVDMEAVLALVKGRGIAVVEDCSHAHGASVHQKPVGSFGDVAAFSCHASKLVGVGAGGVLTTQRREVYERAVLLGHFLDRSEEEVLDDELRQFVDVGWGMNLRMHPLAAAIGIGSVARLDDTLRARQANATLIDSVLKDSELVRPPVKEPHMTSVAYYSYQPLFVGAEGLSRTTFVSAMKAEGIPLSAPRTPPLHTTVTFGKGRRPSFLSRAHQEGLIPSAEGGFPGCETYFESALRLPALSTPDDRLPSAIAAAIAKVHSNLDALRKYDRSLSHSAAARTTA